MHEYTLMQGIIKAILERLEEEKATDPVKEVVLTVGILEIHSAAAARQAFEVLTRGTLLEGARLTVKAKPVMQNCPTCRKEVPYPVDEDTHTHDILPVVTCSTCGGLATLTGGEGIEAIELIFEE